MAKGLLQSKTALSIFGLVGTSVTAILAMFLEWLPIITSFLTDIIGDPFSKLIEPVMAIIAFIITFFLGKKGIEGRIEAKEDIRGFYIKD
jgi:hypothetical protein